MTDDTYRILAPSEYRGLLAAIHKLDYRMMVETMMNTGMRYEELRKFGQRPEWFSAKDRCITLPASATKTRRGRVVHLTPQFSEKLEMFIDGSVKRYPERKSRKGKFVEIGINGPSRIIKFPRRESMNKNLERWYDHTPMRMGTAGIHCKTFRKTWETWLIFAGYDSLKVAASQGHTQTVQISSYQNLIGSLKNEVEQVKEQTRGWMT